MTRKGIGGHSADQAKETVISATSLNCPHPCPGARKGSRTCRFQGMAAQKGSWPEGLDRAGFSASEMFRCSAGTARQSAHILRPISLKLRNMASRHLGTFCCVACYSRSRLSQVASHARCWTYTCRSKHRHCLRSCHVCSIGKGWALRSQSLLPRIL